MSEPIDFAEEQIKRGRVPEGYIRMWVHACGCSEFHLTPDGPWCLRCERVVEGWP